MTGSEPNAHVGTQALQDLQVADFGPHAEGVRSS